jgi:alkanesulfonate monooxygenase SsuD/methylene tetrahydromethanopterin reductase-like flavin-dependent oxidoreductase (luciferase family)
VDLRAPDVSELRLGIFMVPDATNPAVPIEAAIAADSAGLDYVAIQDHPYQRRFFDTWTLLSYLAARTDRVRLLPDVINLPLRPPSVLAKSVASLDLLTGGRVDLGIGAGSFWEAVEAMGGPRRTPGESVDALEEAIAILRGFWSGERSVTVKGEHYRVRGARPGPSPAHPIGLYIGAYGPRMLRLTGRLGDGWLPSVGEHYLAPEYVEAAQALVDEGALGAGRDPSEIVRAANVIQLTDSPLAWPDQLARVVELGFTTVLVGVPEDDTTGAIRRLGEETFPRLRTLVR